jgi:hypothetical protein
MVDASHLYRSDGQESELAAALLKQHHIEFDEIYGNEPLVDEELSSTYFSPMFASSTGDSMIPSLFALNGQPPNLPREAYLSFAGVRSFVRRRLSESLGLKLKVGVDSFMYYPHEEAVTCIDATGEREFVGPIEQAPHKILPFLQLHDFQDWQHVSSRNLGQLNHLFIRKGDLYLNPRWGLLFSPMKWPYLLKESQ